MNEKGLVAYEKWKASDADRKALNEYLRPIRPGRNSRERRRARGLGDQCLQRLRDPLDSRNSTPRKASRRWTIPLAAEAHPVGAKGRAQRPQHGTLRPLIGYRAHAALVCCARSLSPAPAHGLCERRTEPSDRRRISDLVRARGSQPHFAGDKQRRGFEHLQVVQRGLSETAGGLPKILGRYGPEAQRAPSYQRRL